MKSGEISLTQTKLTIGGLAKSCKVSVSTVRYYQQIGLLAEPPKPKHKGYRIYDESHIACLEQIRNAQSHGFSLKEIESIFEYIKKDDCKSVKSLIAKRVSTIQDQAKMLKESLRNLTKLSECCDGKHSEGACPLIKMLGKKKS